METTHRESIDKLRSLIADIEIAMLNTLNGDEIRSRPMATLEMDKEGYIWFFTNEFSEKAEELKQEHKVCLTYSEPGRHTYVSVNAYAEIVNDRSMMEKLYNPAVDAFFPKGLNDPKLCLLKVRPYEAEYWDSHSDEGMVRFMGILGSSPMADEELHHHKHGRINL